MKLSKGIEGVVVTPSDHAKYNNTTFTDEEFEAEYQSIRRGLKARGVPLYRQTAERLAEVIQRELRQLSRP